MKIGIASDHRGFQMKSRVVQLLESMSHQVQDFGPEDSANVDYPDFARLVARAVSGHDVDRGILICGTGIGMAITANKYPGVRAAPCHDAVTAEYSRLHNDANVICLSSNQLSDAQTEQIIRIWLTTAFEEGRHARRLQKIHEVEQEAAGLVMHDSTAADTPGC